MENESLRRIPRSLTELCNVKLIDRLYEMGGNVMIDVIVYLASMQMRSLFGEVWFTINDFCASMGHERTNLQRKLSKEQLQELFGKQEPQYVTMIDGQRIEHPIETLFEAALYKLGRENLALPVKTEDGMSFNFVQILSRFDIKTNFKTKKGTKRYYMCRLSSEIQNTLFPHYNLVDLNDYRRLSERKGFRYFYLDLSKMIYLIKYKIERGESPCFKYTVDQLAAIFDVNVVLDKRRKQKITEILKSINNSLTVTKFEWEYIRENGEKWAYTVKFNFPQETLDYFDEKFNAVFTKRYYDELQGLYAKEILNIDSPIMRVRAMKELLSVPEKYKDFVDWVHSEQNKEKKLTVYKEVFHKVFGKFPEEMGSSGEEQIIE
jgi:hypothetical protein